MLGLWPAGCVEDAVLAADDAELSVLVRVNVRLARVQHLNHQEKKFKRATGAGNADRVTEERNSSFLFGRVKILD